MIERQFVAQRSKEYQIHEFISENLKRVGHSHTKMIRTPLGEKIIIFASRPGLIVGRKGQSIKRLTKVLKKKFNLENPQIEISEVENIYLDAQIVAEMIASSLERFGQAKFKAIGHKMMLDVMNAGALGIEIKVSGKVPSQRAKVWRFYLGYLKKCGDISKDIRTAYSSAQLRTGTIGIQVRIMPPDIHLPDAIRTISPETAPSVEESKTETAKENIANVADEEKTNESAEEKPKQKRARKKKEVSE